VIHEFVVVWNATLAILMMSFFVISTYKHFGVSIDMLPVQFSQFVICPNQVYEKTPNLPNF
jgi:hypothetical protein